MDKKTRKATALDRKSQKQRVEEYTIQLTSDSDEDILEKCLRLMIQISQEKIGKTSDASISMLTDQYEAVLNQIEQRGLYNHTTKPSSSFKYYPDYKNTNFNDEIYRKKEFYLHRGKALEQGTKDEMERVSKKLCDPLFDSITGERVSDKSKIMFNLTNSQKFLKAFMSPSTPYNSLLMYHGTGVGKTCTSISIAEQYIDILQKENKKVFIILNQSIKENFVKNIFNVQKIKSDMPYYQCTGESYLKHIPDYKNMTVDEIQKKIMKLVKSRYEFYGYQKFANMITNLESKIKERFSESVAPRVFEKKIKEMFSNNVMIIDEAHNIKEGDVVKVLPPILERVIKIAENMKLLLLTATPMFDNATEIIWLLNLLLMNQKRPTLKLSDFFDAEGKLISAKIPILKKKMYGLVSYVRGENPLRFPEGKYPTDSTAIIPSKAPKKTIDGDLINAGEQIKELVLVNCPMSGLQKQVYANMIDSDSQFGAFKQPGIMCSNIVYPPNNLEMSAGSATRRKSPSESPSSSSNSESSTNNSPSFTLNDYIGDNGFSNVAEKTKEGERVIFNINPKRNVFLEENLVNFSAKISTLLDNVKKSEGVVFIYSQFINSGVIPVALALEHAGYSKYGGSLLKKEKRPNLGKYIIISGSNDLSKNAYRNYLRVENENKDGKRIKIIIGSETASEGLDFRFIRSVHILEPWFHLNKIDQVVGRAIRNCSHIDLPPDKRNVTIHYYCSTNPDNSQNESLDISIYREAERKSRNMAEVEYIIKTSAVDCEINKSNNNFTTDKDYSRRCNYRKCNYTCDGISKSNIGESDLNYDTINTEVLRDVSEDVIKVLKYGNNKERRLFAQGSIFNLVDILKYVDMDLLVTLIGLNRLIVSRDKIVDKYGRKSILKYKNGLYVLVPETLEGSVFTQDDLRVTPYKKTRKIEIKGTKIKEFISGLGDTRIIISEMGKPLVKKILLKSRVRAQNTPALGELKTKKSPSKVDNPTNANNVSQNQNQSLAKNQTIYDKLIEEIIEYSSINYLRNIIDGNNTKEIYDESGLEDIFGELKYYWLDYLEPNRKVLVCKTLIEKYYAKTITKEEMDIMNNLYNIMTNKDVFYKDITFKGDDKKVWGFKYANYDKKMVYLHYDTKSKQFIKATTAESQAIQKSFLKRQKEKSPEFLEQNSLIGYIELKLPQKSMLFKIRDQLVTPGATRKDGKVKKTQIRTGSICNNDGMKKDKVIEFMTNLLEFKTDLPYEGVDKKILPNKNLLCIQLESLFRYFDIEKRKGKRYFFNYEESIEHKLSHKKN
jgi:hypothetical protein